MTANRFRFRAWNVKDGLPIELLVYEGGEYKADREGERPPYFDIGSLAAQCNIVIEQSTGLVDKNGKEIFEGDIIQFQLDGEAHVMTVEWEARRDMQGFDIGGDIEPVIIGNIHQNPELLK